MAPRVSQGSCRPFCSAPKTAWQTAAKSASHMAIRWPAVGRPRPPLTQSAHPQRPAPPARDRARRHGSRGPAVGPAPSTGCESGVAAWVRHSAAFDPTPQPAERGPRIRPSPALSRSRHRAYRRIGRIRSGDSAMVRCLVDTAVRRATKMARAAIALRWSLGGPAGAPGPGRERRELLGLAGGQQPLCAEQNSTQFAPISAASDPLASAPCTGPVRLSVTCCKD